MSVWCLVFGVWCLVFGVWCLVFGVWCLVFDHGPIGLRQDKVLKFDVLIHE